MKKFFVTMFAAFAMFAMVSCGGNAAVEAGNAFLENPTKENYDKLISASKELEGDDAAEYAQWLSQNQTKIAEACQKLGVDMVAAAQEEAAK